MIIGLAGPAGCGKSTLSGEISRLYGFKAVGFADSLRRIVLKAHPEIKPEWVHGESKLRATVLSDGRTVRDIMIATGEALRDEDEDFFLTLPANGDLVVADVRFANEAAYIRGRGGFIAWIARGDNAFAKDRAEYISPADCDFLADNTQSPEVCAKNIYVNAKKGLREYRTAA